MLFVIIIAFGLAQSDHIKGKLPALQTFQSFQNLKILRIYGFVIFLSGKRSLLESLCETKRKKNHEWSVKLLNGQKNAFY